MKELLTVGLGLAFAALNVIAIHHGKSWEESGSGWSWHAPVVFLAGGAAYVATGFLSRQEAGHVFMAFLDGILVIGTLALLFAIFREPTSGMQWAGVCAVVIGLALVLFGRPVARKADDLGASTKSTSASAPE